MLLLALAFAGSLVGPRWNPPPLSTPLTVASANTQTSNEPIASLPVTSEVITGRYADGAAFRATIYRPETEARQLPGVVFLHGAGTSDHRWFAPHAKALAAAGMVALVPDKPLADYTLSHRSYEKMAADYGAAVQLLRSQREVDADKVGLYAESEGAYIGPIIAAEDPDIAFVALISAPVVNPRQQAAFATDNYLRNTFVPAPVFHNIPRMLGVQFPFHAFDYADFSVHEYQQRITCPVLMVYGTGDASMPLIQSVADTRADLAARGNRALTVRYYAGANHGIKIDGQLVDDFLRDTAAWITGLPETAHRSPAIAGAQPTQQYLAITPPAAPWFASGNLIVYTALAGPLVAAAGVVIGVPVWAVGALRARSNFTRRANLAAARSLRRNLLRIVFAALLAIIASWTLYIAYLASVASLAVNYQTSTMVVNGGWIFCHLTSIGAVAVFVTAIRAGWYSLRYRIAMPLGLTIITVSALGATVIMCIVGAYWGLFSPMALI